MVAIWFSLFTPHAQAAISFDASSTKAVTTSTASFVVSSTLSVGTGNNELFVVAVQADNCTTTAVTIGGISASEAVTLGSTRSSAIWYTTGISSGVINVSTTFSTSVSSGVIVTDESYFGVAQSLTLDATSSMNLISGANLLITTTTTSFPNDWIVDSNAITGSTVTSTYNASQIALLLGFHNAGVFGSTSYLSTTSTNQYAIGYIGTQNMSEVAAAFKPVVSWSYYSSITVTSTNSIASGTNINFPMEVSSTETYWKASSTGGTIQNLVIAPNGNQEPADLVFASSTSNCITGNYLNFETESYTSSTGALIDWINVPSVSMGTVIYACYDASSVTTDQSHPSSTWNNNFALVWHFPTVNALLNASDSTLNANNGTINSATAGIGIIDGGDANPNTSITVNSNTSTVIYRGNFTVSVWINTTSTASFVALYDKGNAGGNRDLSLFMNAGKLAFCGLANTSDCGSISGTTTINDGNWHDIVWSRSGSANTFYVDGKIDATITDGDTGNGGFPISLGGNPSGGGSTFNGTYDEFEMASTSFFPSWILTEYNNQNIPDDIVAGGFYHIGAQTAFGGGPSGEGNAIVSVFGLIVRGIQLL